MNELPEAIPDLWLVRTSANRIYGPFDSDGLRQFIQSKNLEPEDEVCRSEDQWFFLRETQKVKEKLGFEIVWEATPVAETTADEITETKLVKPSVPTATTASVTPKKPPEIEVIGRVESPAILRLMGWALLATVAGLVTWLVMFIRG